MDEIFALSVCKPVCLNILVDFNANSNAFNEEKSSKFVEQESEDNADVEGNEDDEQKGAELECRINVSLSKSTNRHRAKRRLFEKQATAES